MNTTDQEDEHRERPFQTTIQAGRRRRSTGEALEIDIERPRTLSGYRRGVGQTRSPAPRRFFNKADFTIRKESLDMRLSSFLHKMAVPTSRIETFQRSSAISRTKGGEKGKTERKQELLGNLARKPQMRHCKSSWQFRFLRPLVPFLLLHIL